MINRPQRQHAAEGGISVMALCPALGRADVAPTADRGFIDPPGETASSAHCGVICGPVADTVGGLLWHAGEVSALGIPATPPCQSRSESAKRLPQMAYATMLQADHSL